MILGLEIGLFVFGLMAVINGRMKFGENKVVEGLGARLLGLLAMAPLPLAFTVGFVYGFMKAANDPNFDADQFAQDNALALAGVEAAIVIGLGLLVLVIGLSIGVPPERPRRRRDRDDDYDDEPRRRRDEDDEYDDQPRRRPRDDDDDTYDDRPRRRRRDDDD